MVKTALPLQGAWVQSLAGDLRSCMPLGTAKKKQHKCHRKYNFKDDYLFPDANEKTCNNTLVRRRHFLHHNRVYPKKCFHSVSTKLNCLCVRVIHIQLSFPSNYRAPGSMKHGAENNGISHNYLQLETKNHWKNSSSCRSLLH